MADSQLPPVLTAQQAAEYLGVRSAPIMTASQIVRSVFQLTAAGYSGNSRTSSIARFQVRKFLGSIETRAHC